jgi:hypothetical protein
MLARLRIVKQRAKLLSEKQAADLGAAVLLDAIAAARKANGGGRC